MSTNKESIFQSKAIVPFLLFGYIFPPFSGLISDCCVQNYKMDAKANTRMYTSCVITTNLSL